MPATQDSFNQLFAALGPGTAPSMAPNPNAPDWVKVAAAGAAPVRDPTKNDHIKKDISQVTPAATTPAAPASVSVPNYMAGQVQTPILPVGTTLVPQTITPQQGEMATYQPISAPQIAAPDTVVTPTLGAASQVTGVQDVNSNIAYMVDPATGQYVPVQVSGNTPQAAAQQGTVQDLATVQGQLKKLYADTTSGETPLWAKGAVNKAENAMASRGLGNSSIAMGAITAAIQSSAINIAAADAATFFQMDLTNLGNRQQTELLNTQLKQQSLLSDQAALNAALQFNASSKVQVEEFQASLISQIQTQNADRTSAIKQFNASAENTFKVQQASFDVQVQEFNSQAKTAVDQFNATLKSNTDQFNATMAQAIDQSNVQWRREINTANTAAINAANQSNIQNKFNLSTYSLNALWQQMRDEANWLWQSSERQADREAALGQIATQRDANLVLQNNASDLSSSLAYQQALGKLAFSILDPNPVAKEK